MQTERATLLSSLHLFNLRHLLVHHLVTNIGLKIALAYHTFGLGVNMRKQKTSFIVQNFWFTGLPCGQISVCYWFELLVFGCLEVAYT